MEERPPWATSKGKDRGSEVNEMRILRWKCGGVTKEDKIGPVRISISLFRLSGTGKGTWRKTHN